MVPAGSRRVPLAIDEDFDIEPWLDELRDAIGSLDLVVVVPIETPDRIAVPGHEDRRLRRQVDERLKTLTLEDGLGLDVATLEVTGDLDQRVRAVMALLLPKR